MRSLYLSICLLISVNTFSQSVSAKSNEISFDFSDLNKNYSISIPTIIWTNPVDTISYLKNGKFIINAEVKSLYGLNSVELRIRDRKNKKLFKELSLMVDQASNNDLLVNQDILLPDGEFEIELSAANTEGFSSRVYRVAIVTIEPDSKKKK